MMNLTLKTNNGMGKGLLAAAVLGVSGALAHGNFVQVVSFGELGGPDSRSIQNFVFTSNSELIVAINGASSGGTWSGQAINRVTGVGTGNVQYTTIMDGTAWGNNSFSPLRSSFTLNGGILSFGVTGLASVAGIYDVNMDTGMPSARITAEGIQNAITGNFNMSVAIAEVPSGDFFVYNSNSGNRSLLRISGSTPSIILDQAGIEDIFGSGGTIIHAMTALGDGRLIMANGQNNVIALFDPVSMIGTPLLTEAELGGQTFQSFFSAPDGMVYFNNSSRVIYRFDPADAVNSLTLLVADAGSGINAMGWYEGNIAWAPAGNNPDGIYAVPEPSHYAIVLSILAMAAVIWRRRK